MKKFIKFLLTILFTITPQLLIADESIYLIKNNKVNLLSENILDARQSAMKIAFENGFMKLLKKIVPNNEINKIINKEDLILENLVEDYRLKNETFLDSTYNVLIDVNFKENSIINILNKYEIELSNIKSEVFLVLPIYYQLNTFYLWEKNNIWLKKLKKNYDENTFLKLAFPEPNILNKFTLSVDQALNGDVESLDKILNIYKKKSALLLFFKEEYDYKKGLFINSTELINYSSGILKNLEIKNNDLVLKETKKTNIDAIAKLTLDELQNWWKNETSILKLDKKKIKTFEIVYKFKSLQELVFVENLVKKNSIIVSLVPLIFNNKIIKYNLSSYGSLEKINLALKADNINIYENEDLDDLELINLN